MPVTKGQEPTKDSAAFEFPMARLGVNLWKSRVDIGMEESPMTQNLVYRNGMVKRGGQVKNIATQVSGSNAITGLHRYYSGSGTKWTIANAGTIVAYWNGSSWVNIQTGLTSGKQMNICTWQNVAYFGNSTDTPFKWDGTTMTQLSGGGYTNPPVQAIQFLPYADRLLVIENYNTGSSRYGALRWSNSYDDTTFITAASANVKPDSYLYGMCLHSSTNQNSGYTAKVLLAGASGMYLFSGTNLAVSGGDYTIYPLGIKTGCFSPRTMAWTPAGTIFLGSDRQLYLLPFASSNSPYAAQAAPVPIGRKITGITSSIAQTLDKIPQAYSQLASAVYHKGWYILSIPISSGALGYNTVQWWFDILRIYQDDCGFGPFYGPMTGQSINCFAVQGGNGDLGELLGGEGNGANGSYVYELNRDDVYGDNGNAIDCIYQTAFNPMGNPRVLKNIQKVEIEARAALGGVQMNVSDMEGPILQNISANLTSNAIYWNDAYWSVNYWANSSPTRVQLDVQPVLQARRPSFQFEHNVSTDTVELYSAAAQGDVQDKIFDVRA